MQPQAQQFSQQQQQQQQMPSQAQQPSEGMSQRGSATSLQDLRQSAAASGEEAALYRRHTRHTCTVQ